MKTALFPACPSLALLVFAPPLFAAELGPGDLDPDFGDPALRRGVVELPLPAGYPVNDAYTLAVRFDAAGNHLILSHGCNDADECALFLHRLDAAGVADPTFNNDTGYVQISDTADETVVQSARNGLEIASDGSIWLSYTLSIGAFEMDVDQVIAHAVRRIGADGVPDAAFGDNGVRVFEPADENENFIAWDTAVTGDDLLLARSVRLDVTPEPTFSIEIVTIDSAAADYTTTVTSIDENTRVRDIDVDSNGRVVVHAMSPDGADDFLYRLAADGSGLDATFSGDGRARYQDWIESLPGWAALDENAFYSYAEDIEIDSNDRLIIAGTVCCTADIFAEKVPLIRVDTDGAVDTTFGNANGDGWATDEMSWFPIAYRLALDSNDNIALHIKDDSIGDFAYRLHLDADGAPDPAFGANGLFLRDAIGWVNDLRFDANDRLVAAGEWGPLQLSNWRRAAVARYLAVGDAETIDTEPDPKALSEERHEWFEDPVKPVGQFANFEMTTVATITGAGLVVNGGERTIGSKYLDEGESMSGHVSPGDTFEIEFRMPRDPGGVKTVTLTIDETEMSFDVITYDDELDDFTLPALNDVEPGELAISPPVTITGIDIPVDILVYSGNPGLFSINGGPFTDFAEVRNNDVVRFAVTMPAAYSASAVGTFNWDSGPDDHSISLTATTKAAPLPDDGDDTSDGDGGDTGDDAGNDSGGDTGDGSGGNTGDASGDGGAGGGGSFPVWLLPALGVIGLAGRKRRRT